MEYWLFGSFITVIGIIGIDIIKNIKKNQPMTIQAKGYWLISIIIVVVIAYAAALIWGNWPISDYSINQSGLFGDSFGILTSLFSGLAFAGLIITILLQREDIDLQRTELEDTRRELKFQNFETTFFQMLRLHNSIVDSIDLRNREDQKVISSGRDCFTTFYKKLDNLYKPFINCEVNEHQKYISEAYKAFWHTHKQDLSHYFRYLYRVFKYVHDSFIDDDKKKLYTSIIRAQLSDMETALLFYNCLTENGREKFMPLAEEYALFDNLPTSLLFNIKHKNLYKPSAFKTPEE